MTAKIYLEHKLVKKISLPKQRKERNKQIKEICKEYELKNQPCYVEITGEVGGAICLVNSDNERDSGMLTSYATPLPPLSGKLRGSAPSPPRWHSEGEVDVRFRPDLRSGSALSPLP